MLYKNIIKVGNVKPQYHFRVVPSLERVPRMDALECLILNLNSEWSGRNDERSI